ncbi:MAG: hypothetical protein AAGA20_14155 [Planctomycetota bacterium]
MIVRSLLTLVLCSAAAGQAQFRLLQPLPGFESCFASDVADDGTAVGWSRPQFGVRTAVVWAAAGAPADLGLEGGASAISGDGSTVVGWTNGSSGQRAFRWAAATGSETLGPGNAADVSYDGQVIVGISPSGAFRWTNVAGPSAIPGVLAAFGCNVDGSVLVGEDTAGQPCRWTMSGGLESPLGTWDGGWARAVSDDGATVVGLDAVSRLAYRWTAAGAVELPLPAGETQGFAVTTSGNGELIGGGTYSEVALIWSQLDGLVLASDWLATRGVSVPGSLELTSVTSISPSGQWLAGECVDVSGTELCWVAGLDGTIGDRYCDPATVNSTGAPASISASGSLVASDNDVTLACADLPASSFAVFLVSRMRGSSTPPSSQGTLCLSGSIGRYVGPGEVQTAGPDGSVSLTIDLTRIPEAVGFAAAQPGETWNFTTWYRDSAAGTATTNLSDAVGVTFE